MDLKTFNLSSKNSQIFYLLFCSCRSYSSFRPLDPPSYDTISVASTVSSPNDDDASTNDTKSSLRKPVSLWPGMYHSPVTNALWQAKSTIFSTTTTSKTPSFSRTTILYPFSTDYILREQYRNPWNKIRMGKLMEDLDVLGAAISFKHCLNHTGMVNSLLLVTVSVDKMVLKKPILVDIDLKIVGAVTWVGRSSLEIQLQVIQEILDPLDSQALVANFTFVGRDCKTGKSALINQIMPVTEKEKLLWQEAEERNASRKKRKMQLKNVDCERINALLAEGRVFIDMPALADRDSILMKDTCLQNALVCQPQQRNTHGQIFGGFLMRRAFELAFATAYAFVGSAPCFLEVDHVDFLKHVDVGNFLRFKSCVLYTELKNPKEPLINVEVVAHVTRPGLRSAEVSNKFYFTFTTYSDTKKNKWKIRSVVPATEEEARRVIERLDADNS